MQAPLTRVLLAYRAYTQKQGPAKNAGTQLAAAERTLARLERRLAATPAPPEARKLRRLLLDLVSRQAAITREVKGMAEFSPKFAVALTRARAASGALGKALAAVKAPDVLVQLPITLIVDALSVSPPPLKTTSLPTATE